MLSTKTEFRADLSANLAFRLRNVSHIIGSAVEMRRALRQIGKWLVIGALFASVGGHFALVQTFAWGNMLFEYSRAASLSEAARKTFDGGHPCEMCKLVKKSRENEERKPLVKAEAKLHVVLPVAVRLKEPVSAEYSVELPDSPGSFREVYPPLPHRPPRLG